MRLESLPKFMQPPRRRQDTVTLHVYLVLVSLAGTALLGAMVVSMLTKVFQGGIASGLPLKVGVLMIFVLLGELLTIQLPRAGGRISISTPFVFALMMISGPPAAMIALAVASLLSDLRDRKSGLATAFNVGQICLAIAAAGALLSVLSDLPRAVGPPAKGTDMPEFCIAAAAFFLTSHSLTSAAVAISQRIRFGMFMRTDLGFQLLMATVFISLAPMIARAAADDVILLVMLVLPLASIYKSGREAMLNQHQALHDSLTGLPNRMFYSDTVTQQIRVNQRRETSLAVLMVDLDRFKEINDWLGHHYGDLLLQEIGPRLKGALRETDTVARMGGDEFAILLPEVSDPAAASVVARKVLGSLHLPFEIKGLALSVGASIGIAFSPENGDDVETLLQHADVAMYIAKESGAGFELYSQERDFSTNRIALAEDIQHAIDGAEISLHYQPIVELRTRRIVGVEALARWMHPERGMIGPAEFIPVAEQSGMIAALTMGLVSRGLRERKSWGEAGSGLMLSVNVSPRQLLDLRFPEDLAVVLARHGAQAHTLKLEITESVMGDPNRLREVLQRLRAMGVKLSIDDFGTGYSSLAHLTSLSVDEIKIDRSFVMGMATSPSDAQIVRSTVVLAHNLGLVVVAEGVETEEARDQLLAQGCDCAQGYFLSRPMPPEQFRGWIEQHGTGPDRPVSAVVDADSLLRGGTPSFEERRRARRAAAS